MHFTYQGYFTLKACLSTYLVAAKRRDAVLMQEVYRKSA
jgi:hypothetical protein